MTASHPAVAEVPMTAQAEPTTVSEWQSVIHATVLNVKDHVGAIYSRLNLERPEDNRDQGAYASGATVLDNQIVAFRGIEDNLKDVVSDLEDIERELRKLY